MIYRIMGSIIGVTKDRRLLEYYKACPWYKEIVIEEIEEPKVLKKVKHE